MEWITCENTYDETWRRLLEFANVELAIEAISAIHGLPDKKKKANYKKQAEQARVSLLQAKEYFEAAKNSSLFTQPNHLYYGAVALSTACMLIRGDGSKSLDFLRGNSKNASHGLDFTFSSDINRSKQGFNLLDNSYVKICPNGHFSNWYSTLIKDQKVPAINKYHQPKRGIRSNIGYVGRYSIPDFSELQNMKRDLSFLTKRLPDLIPDLNRFGIPTDSARGELVVNHHMNTRDSDSVFMFHSATSHDALMKIIENFNCEEGVNFCYEIDWGSNSGLVRTKQKSTWPFSFPDSRDTLDHKTIYFADNISTPEVVDLFVISYALSMLSRYFPDVWVSFLESHCKGAKLVERIVRVLMLKLPNLMLNQICGKNLIISNHRPIWY